MKIKIGTHRIHRRFLLKLSVVSLIIFSLLIMIGCTKAEKKQAQDIVQKGTDTSNQLAKFYDTLAKQRHDHKTFTILEAKIGSPNATLNETAINNYKAQDEALTARAEMARNLNKLYISLGKLIEYDAPSEITDSVIGLKDALVKVSGKKLAIGGIDPSMFLKPAINELAAYIQIREFRKSALRAQTVLSSIQKLFDAEKSIYVDISQDYNKIVKTITTRLINQHQIITSEFLQPLAQIYGLKVVQNLTDANINRGTELTLIAEVEEKYQQSDKAVVKDCDDLSKSLADLFKNQEDFILKRKSTAAEKG